MDHPRYPNESDTYRAARNRLLNAEAELRAKTEEVAALRRTLPLGGEAKDDYQFEEIGSQGGVEKTRLHELFADGQDSLLIYGFMYSPKMENACPMCTSFLDSLDRSAPHITQNMSLAIVARSPIERIVEHANSRGWSNLRLISSANNTFQHDYFAEDDQGGQNPMANVFVRRDGKIYHFWGSELFFRANPAGHPRHIDALWPLWNALDWTPEGRPANWYPALSYE